MEHIRFDEPAHRETFEELHALQQDLLDADLDDPRFLDAVPGSVEDVTEQMRQLCGGTLPSNVHVIGASSFEDLTHQFAGLIKGQRQQDGTDR
ncbi:MAG: hypothetical protein PHX87_05165 [Candidatus Peribacteraceae bacterium]|nr:hypothetical protein [Candidatus Peribacteraceae bacterium]MDD5742786.1 hypothetical protein [Candidatus Peribacteraceae bacterium]